MPDATPIPAALELLDYFGIAVFAISGALLAAEKKQTLVTFVFFAVVASVGGGTLRDLLISLAGLMGPMAVVAAAARRLCPSWPRHRPRLVTALVPRLE